MGALYMPSTLDGTAQDDAHTRAWLWADKEDSGVGGRESLVPESLVPETR